MKFTPVVLLFGLVSCTSLARAGDLDSAIPAPKAPIVASWKWSLVPLAASQALDIGSSYGMRELNPLVAGQQNRFDAQSTLLKVGVAAGFIGIEYLIVKAHPASARFFTKANWAAAALTTGFAAHNFSIR
jgi:hypothetical protein